MYLIQNKIKLLSILIAIALFASYVLYTVNHVSEVKKVFVIESGDSLVKIARKLKAEGLIESEAVFKIIFTLTNSSDKSIAYGEYNFADKDYTLLDIEKKISKGVADRAGVAITIPEGFTVRDVAARVSRTYNIDEQAFYNAAKAYEGYLFPETYFFDKTVTKEDIIKKMILEFGKRVGEVSKSDIVLASIIEGEAKDPVDMKIISGILQQRLKIGMPLQVDVARETYKKKGLPDNAINNPSLNAIEAVRDPVYTEYLYYITGKDGLMYYAKTFEEHKKNIDKYLR